MGRQYVKDEYPLSEVTGRVIAAAMEVHRGLGPGFEEVIYQRALALELPAHSLEFGREVWIDVHYKGEKIGRKRVDFVIDEVLVEVKAKARLESGFRPDIVVPQGVWVQGRVIAQLWQWKVRGQASGELRVRARSVRSGFSVFQ